MIATLRAAPTRARLILFAFGDFAFNLYWQSIMLFLLFYYSDALGLPVTTAATIYTIASIWDGIANFAAGALADRREPGRGYGRVLMVGSIPLGIACVLTYIPPPVSGYWAIAFVTVGHLLFRTAYAAANIPYLAMTARISLDSKDRAFVAGMRMFFGTMAWVTVASTTIPLGGWLSGSHVPAHAFLGAAAFFAVIATAILLLVGATYREDAMPVRTAPPSLAASVASLVSNRAFVTLNLAMVAALVAVTVLNKSVLYYFKYFLGDDAAGQTALAWMGVASGAAVLGWMLLQRVTGARTLWFLATGSCMAGLMLFALLHIDRIATMQLFLVVMQALIVGIHFVFWAMLPNTIEYGEHETGLRIEGAVVGAAALLQRVAIGIATTALGWGFGASGYVANVQQSAATLAGMRWTIILIPLGFFTLSCVLMLLNPLGKGEHARIVRRLAGGDS